MTNRLLLACFLVLPFSGCEILIDAVIDNVGETRCERAWEEVERDKANLHRHRPLRYHDSAKQIRARERQLLLKQLQQEDD